MKLQKYNKFYIVILEEHTKEGVYRCKIKQKYWNNRKWKARKKEWH